MSPERCNEDSLKEYMEYSGETFEEWENLLKEGMKVEHIKLANADRYIFYCGICRESAGTISIWDDYGKSWFNISSPWVKESSPYSVKTLDLIVQGIKNKSFKTVSDSINIESILPFYCFECDNCFCEDHWFPFKHLNYRIPMCPKGHKKHRNY